MMSSAPLISRQRRQSSTLQISPLAKTGTATTSCTRATHSQCAGGEGVPMRWDELLPLLQDFWQQARRKLAPRYAPGRLKQWLAMLTRSYPEAVALFAEIRRENDCARIDALLRPLQAAS